MTTPIRTPASPTTKPSTAPGRLGQQRLPIAQRLGSAPQKSIHQRLGPQRPRPLTSPPRARSRGRTLPQQLPSRPGQATFEATPSRAPRQPGRPQPMDISSSSSNDSFHDAPTSNQAVRTSTRIRVQPEKLQVGDPRQAGEPMSSSQSSSSFDDHDNDVTYVPPS